MSWSTKYYPQSSSDLCVGAKKVKEIKEWLLSRTHIAPGPKGGGEGGKAELFPTPNASPPVLVLTGPTGGGKSTTVELLCKELDIKLLTWNAPTPTLWHEYLYQSGPGNTYVSKLGEFESFMRRSTLLSQIPLLAPQRSPTISSSSNSSSKTGVGSHSKKEKKEVIFIDDMPNMHTSDQHKSMLSVLDKYCRSSRFPIVICLSNVHKSVGEKDRQSYFQDRVLLSLESMGALVVNFPPITTPRITKVLQRISDKEKVIFDKRSLTEIAETSNGDIRNAVNSLQFSMVGVGGSRPRPREEEATAAAARASNPRLKRKRKKQQGREPAGLLSRQKLELDIQRDLARDRELEQFHVLGKILYNKRTDEKPDDYPGGLQVLERLRRNKSENKVEEIIAQTHLDNRMLLSYVHENFLRFVGEDAIEEVAQMAEYFSDAAMLMGGDYNSDLAHPNIGVSPSSLVGVMGFQYANVSKPPRSFLKLRKPDVIAVEKTRIMNHFELSNACTRRSSHCLYLEAMNSLVTDTLPYTRKIYQGSMNGLLHAWHDKCGTTTLIPQPQPEHHHHGGFGCPSSWQDPPPAGTTRMEEEDEIEFVP